MNIVVEGVRYSNFLSAEVESRMDALARRFSFTASTLKGATDLPFRPGQTCEILVDGDRVMTGFIERIESRTDSTGNSYVISGRDKMADVMDSNLPGFADTGPTLKKVCENVLAYLGIKSKVIDQASTGDRPFEAQLDIVAPEPTDSAFDFLTSVAKRRNALLTSDGEGNLVITRGLGVPTSQRLVNRVDGVGNNLVEAEFVVDHSQRFGLYVSESQLNVAAIGSGGGTARADQIAGSKSTFKDPDGIRRSRIRSITSESSYPPSDERNRAVWECNVARARSREYTATVPSWRDQNGVLWEANTAPIVEDEFAGINTRMLVTGVRFSLNEEGRTTVLTLTDRDAFKVLAEESSGYDF